MILTNDDLAKIVDTSDAWITARTGIKERRKAADNEAASDLAVPASRRALEMAGLKAKQIDLIIVATTTGDMPFPSTACILQEKIGAKHAAAFDVNAACSGFIYALSVADNFIRAGSARTVLVVGTEVLTRFLDWTDRTTCVLFGDGCGAMIVEATDEDRGILSTHIFSDGAFGDYIKVPAGGSAMPASEASVKGRQHSIRMMGNETFKVAVKTLEKVVVDTLAHNKLKPSQLDLLIPHQANMRIIKATAERLAMPMEKVVVNIEKYGNTSAASVPIALDEAVRSGRIKDGDIIMLEAFGAGLTWASALLKW